MPFSRLTLLARNLRYFRAANLAVLAGMAVATAVLTGALMVSDSVRGSLRDLADPPAPPAPRLGFVDHALIAPTFVDEAFAKRISSAPGFADRFESIAPAITL